MSGINSRAPSADNPVPFIGTETIEIDGGPVAVRETEFSQEYHCRVLTAVDGSAYLEYPVSVGRFKTEISAIHVFSRDEIAAREAGSLHVGEFAATLSQIAQATGKFERQDSAPTGTAAYARGLGALLHLMYMEEAVLDKIKEIDSNPTTRATAVHCAERVKRWIPEIIVDLKLSDPAELTRQARTWATRLASLDRFVELTSSGNPWNAERQAIESAIYDTSMQLWKMPQLGAI